MASSVENQEVEVERHWEEGACCFGRRSWDGFSNQDCICLSMGYFVGED